MALTCSRFLPARDACTLDTAYTLNCLFSTMVCDDLFWFLMFCLFLLRNCIYFLPGICLSCLPYESVLILQSCAQTCGEPHYRCQICCFLTFLENYKMLKSYLSFSFFFLSFLIFFFISTANKIKMRCVTFCKIGIPCGGIQLKRRSYFVK